MYSIEPFVLRIVNQGFQQLLADALDTLADKAAMHIAPIPRRTLQRFTRPYSFVALTIG